MDEPEVLDAGRCWSHLRAAEVGRVAAVVDGVVTVRPVNFAVDGGGLLIRTGHGSVIAALAGATVVFEADGTEQSAGSDGPVAAWSVLVNGTLRAVSGAAPLLETFDVPLFPWHASPKPVFLRLVPDSMSGRRFLVADASTWSTPLDDLPRSATE